MSRLGELIQELCPDGVEYKPLGELGVFYGGLSGKTKEDFKDGNAKFISYKNIFNNPSLNLDTDEKVKIAEGEKQHTIQYGDILFTGSSETPDECGMSSVLTTQTDEKLYLNSFCFGFRLNDLSQFDLNFLKHLFRSHELRVQIGKTASGTTRFNVSKAKFANVTIPVPPMAVQEEIVRILDKYSDLQIQLQNELQAELQKRLQQYNYYRDKLLSFNGIEAAKVKWMKLGEIVDVYTGGEAPEYCIKGEQPCGDYKYPIWANGKNVYGYTNTYKIDKDAVCISSIGANTGDVFFHKAFFTPIIRLKVLVPKDSSINIRYLYHAVSTIEFSAKKSSVPNMNANEVKNAVIPVPPLAEQERIVAILDRFDTLCTDLTTGIPAEIEGRRKQYEYYRDKLLNFTPLS